MVSLAAMNKTQDAPEDDGYDPEASEAPVVPAAASPEAANDQTKASVANEDDDLFGDLDDVEPASKEFREALAEARRIESSDPKDHLPREESDDDDTPEEAAKQEEGASPETADEEDKNEAEEPSENKQPEEPEFDEDTPLVAAFQKAGYEIRDNIRTKFDHKKEDMDLAYKGQLSGLAAAQKAREEKLKRKQEREQRQERLTAAQMAAAASQNSEQGSKNGSAMGRAVGGAVGGVGSAIGGVGSGIGALARAIAEGISDRRAEKRAKAIGDLENAREENLIKMRRNFEEAEKAARRSEEINVKAAQKVSSNANRVAAMARELKEVVSAAGGESITAEVSKIASEKGCSVNDVLLQCGKDGDHAELGKKMSELLKSNPEVRKAYDNLDSSVEDYAASMTDFKEKLNKASDEKFIDHDKFKNEISKIVDSQNDALSKKLDGVPFTDPEKGAAPSEKMAEVVKKWKKFFKKLMAKLAKLFGKGDAVEDDLDEAEDMTP